MLEFLIIYSFICYHHLQELSCRPQDNAEGVVAMQWRILTLMLFVQDVVRRVRGLMTVLKIPSPRIVKFAMPSLKNNAFSLPLPHIVLY